jgi:hypothetical protein
MKMVWRSGRLKGLASLLSPGLTARSPWRVFVLILLALSCQPEEPPREYTSLDGAWSCQESSAYAGIRKYLVEVDRVSGEEGLYIISNFHNMGENEFLFASLSGDSIRIFSQTIGELRVTGKGTFESDFRLFKLLYTTDDGTTMLEFLAQYTR